MMLMNKNAKVETKTRLSASGLIGFVFQAAK